MAALYHFRPRSVPASLPPCHSSEVGTPGVPSDWITQTAMFDPVDLLAPLYWYAVWPLHQWVFAGMLHKIARAAESMP